MKEKMENLEYKLKKIPDLIPGIGLITYTIRNAKIRESKGEEIDPFMFLKPKNLTFLAYQIYSMMLVGFPVYLLVQYLK